MKFNNKPAERQADRAISALMRVAKELGLRKRDFDLRANRKAVTLQCDFAVIALADRTAMIQVCDHREAPAFGRALHVHDAEPEWIAIKTMRHAIDQRRLPAQYTASDLGPRR